LEISKGVREETEERGYGEKMPEYQRSYSNLTTGFPAKIHDPSIYNKMKKYINKYMELMNGVKTTGEPEISGVAISCGDLAGNQRNEHQRPQRSIF